MATQIRLSPFLKQCFVTAGVAINFSGVASVMAFTTGMLPQLRESSSGMAVDDSLGSWIAATPSMCLLLGNFITPTLMTTSGRRTTNIISITILAIGWLLLALAESITVIILSRFLQGISIGMALNLGPTLIGEYTSPKNRGAFLMFVSVLTAAYVLLTHGVGSYLSWHTNALICMLVTFVNLLIALYSPESPAWLSQNCRYDECKIAFRWLRGDDEEKELEEILRAGIILHDSKGHNTETILVQVKNNFAYIKNNVTEREFYMPIFIMLHVYAIAQWAGINVLATYTNDVFKNIIGEDNNIALHVIALDGQRLVSTVFAVFMIQKFKRRKLLCSIASLGIVIMVTIAGYTYARALDVLPFDHPYIGVALIHIHMFTIASCTSSLPYTIAGEIFPLKHKGVAGGISIVAFSIHFSIVVKCTPLLFKSIGIYGAYILYSVVVAYCLLITMMFLPETKDRTLQDIENECKGKEVSNIDVIKTAQTLTSRLVNK